MDALLQAVHLTGFFFIITSKSENLCVQGDKSSSNLSSLFNLIMKVPIPYHSNTLIC